MAKAQVIRERPIDPPVKEVILRLTEPEAKHIMSLTGRCTSYIHADAEDESPALNDTIYYALSSAGIEAASGPAIYRTGQS